MSESPCKRDDQFVECTLDEETVLMKLADGDFFTLKGSAAAIWPLIDGVRSRAAITAELQSRFDGAKSEIERDVEVFVSELRKAGFVT